MKRVLLIGGGGFVGGYLIDRLLSEGHTVIATNSGPVPHPRPHVTYESLDLLDAEATKSLVASTQPDWVVHLAAQSSVGLSWQKPGLTVDINVRGAVNLLEAIRLATCDPRVLIVGSSEQYGGVSREDGVVRENDPKHPGNVYAVTKNAQEELALVYRRAYGMDVVMTRAFNHVGPGQALGFVLPDFCSQVVRMERGQCEPVMRVGNLDARRDFTDVRDVVAAYQAVLEHGRPGEAYNVGSGIALPIRQLLEWVVANARIPVEVRVDKNKLRAVDVPVVRADITKLQHDTGWAPTHDLQGTVAQTLQWWRDNWIEE